MKCKTIYLTAIPGGLEAGDVIGTALCECGEGLVSHLSSSVGFAKHDMGLTGNWKHDIYKEHCPDGFDLVWVDDYENDPRWGDALAKNREKYPQEENKS